MTARNIDGVALSAQVRGEIAQRAAELTAKGFQPSLAVILVGGEGTRLRPLTSGMPKPMLPLVDRPMLAYTFEHLHRHGVDHAILSCGYLPTPIEEHFGDHHGDLRLVRSDEVWTEFVVSFRSAAEPGSLPA